MLGSAQRSVPMMICIFPILLLISGVCLGGDVVLSPGPVYGAVGGSVWINTTISPADEPLRVVWWSFNNTKVVSSSLSLILPEPKYKDRIKLDTFTGSLQLWNLTVNDTGKCSVTIKKTGTDPEITDTITLIVSDKRTSPKDPSDGLSGGAIAGIVIGVLVVVGIIGAGVYMKRGTFTRANQNDMI